MVYLFYFTFIWLIFIGSMRVNICKYTMLGSYGKWQLQKMNDVYCGGHDVTWYLVLRYDEIAGSVCTQKCIYKPHMFPNCPITFFQQLFNSNLLIG